MSGKNEHPRPDHQIHDMNIHHSKHGHLDQKHDKGMRSPMISQLPFGGEMESPSNESGAPQGDGMGG